MFMLLLHPHLEREFYNLCNRFTFIEKKVYLSLDDSTFLVAVAAVQFIYSMLHALL